MSSVDRLLADARAELGPRPGPADLDRLVAEGALLVDTRPEAVRREEGALPGAVVVERNVLEWRLAPDSEHRLPEAGDPDQVVVLVCNEGYASSLAAVALRRLGLRHATDLDGGYRAWRAAHA
ncbi:MAG TPA: rhodanese-like domain-containing protein [Iamia sp.]